MRNSSPQPPRCRMCAEWRPPRDTVVVYSSGDCYHAALRDLASPPTPCAPSPASQQRLVVERQPSRRSDAPDSSSSSARRRQTSTDAASRVFHHNVDVLCLNMAASRIASAAVVLGGAALCMAATVRRCCDMREKKGKMSLRSAEKKKGRQDKIGVVERIGTWVVPWDAWPTEEAVYATRKISRVI